MKSKRSISTLFSVGFLVLNVFGSVASAETVKVSNFTPDGQGYVPWCWASAARMALMQKVNIRKETCELVSEVLEKNCCGIFRDRGCFVAGRVDRVFSKNGYNTQYLPADTKYVINLIRSDRVAILGLSSTRPGALGHVSVVYGIENIDDPSKIEFLIYDSTLGRIRARPNDIKQRYAFDRKTVFRWTYTQALAD